MLQKGNYKNIKIQQNSLNFYKKSIDFYLLICYYYKCTKEHMKNEVLN